MDRHGPHRYAQGHAGLAHPKTAAASRGSTTRSTPALTPLISTMTKPTIGLRAMIPKPSTYSQSKLLSPASPHAATLPQSALSNQHKLIAKRCGLHRMDTIDRKQATNLQQFGSPNQRERGAIPSSSVTHSFNLQSLFDDRTDEGIDVWQAGNSQLFPFLQRLDRLVEIGVRLSASFAPVKLLGSKRDGQLLRSTLTQLH